MDRIGEVPGIGQVRGLGLHPQEVGERGDSQRSGDRVLDSALDLVIALGSLGSLAVPDDVDAHRPGPGPGGVEGRSVREGQPLAGAQVELLTLAGAEFHHVRHRLGIAHQVGLGLPCLQIPRLDTVHQCFDRGPVALQECLRALFEHARHTRPVKPRAGLVVLLGGDLVQQMTARVLDAQLAELPQDGEVPDLVGRQFNVGGAQDERMIALVPAPLKERGRFGVGPGHDDAWHLHDVELEARGAQPLDLLVHTDEHLASLVPALLGAGLLVLDVVARDPDLNETADQIPDVRIATMSGVGVGNDERPVVDLGRGSTLRRAHAGPGEPLVPVRREQGAHYRRGLVGHLGERVAGQVGPRVLGHRAPGRGGPAAEVDALDAHPLQRHRLTR